MSKKELMLTFHYQIENKINQGNWNQNFKSNNIEK